MIVSRDLLATLGLYAIDLHVDRLHSITIRVWGRMDREGDVVGFDISGNFCEYILDLALVDLQGLPIVVLLVQSRYSSAPLDLAATMAESLQIQCEEQVDRVLTACLPSWVF